MEVSTDLRIRPDSLIFRSNPIFSSEGICVVLLILAAIWAAALLPPFVRSRLEGNPVDSIGRFRRHLRVLQSTSPAASSLASDPVLVRSTGPKSAMPAHWASEARRLRRLRRRRQVSIGLLAAMGTTLVIGLVPAFHIVLVAHVLIDLLFAGYVAMLARSRVVETERQMTAHFAELREETTELDFEEPLLQQQAF
jgi:hypothetical protein